MRNDERLAAEPALATQSFTGLFIVQEDAPSLSHNNIFFLLLCVSSFWARKRERKRAGIFSSGGVLR